MRHAGPLLIMIGFLMAAPGHAESAFAEEEFTEDDFAQFFSLISDGKISAEKMGTRCADQSIGFTFAGTNIRHEGGQQRIFYNVSRENTSVDGRTLRAKHFNASFGEWTGAVFKPLCPGLYALSIDFSTAVTGDDEAGDVYVHVYHKRDEDERPGRKIVTAIKTGPDARGSGHATVALPLHSGDEISTYSEVNGVTNTRVLRSITFTAYKVVHLKAYIEEIDMDAWTADITMLKKSNIARDPD